MVRARATRGHSSQPGDADPDGNEGGDESGGGDDGRPAVEMTVAGSHHHPTEPVLEAVADTTRRALHRFFYPSEGRRLKRGVRVMMQASEEELRETQADDDDGAAAAGIVVLEEEQPQQEQQRGAGGASAPSSAETSTAQSSTSQPQQQQQETTPASAPNEALPPPTDQHHRHHHHHHHHSASRSNYDPRTQTADRDRAFVHNFWTTYDDILILSIFTQLGILFRLASSSWFAAFGGNVFSNESPLFVNLPLNCWSCFILGLLCSGERLLEIIHTRFAPPRTQQSVFGNGGNGNGRDDDEYEYDDDDDNEMMMPIITEEPQSDDYSAEDGGGGRRLRRNHRNGNQHRSLAGTHPLAPRSRRRRPKRHKQQSPHFVSWQPPVHLNEELRDVQLLALERRIRMSRCLLLFPVRKQDVDVMEHYFGQGYKKDHHRNHRDNCCFDYENESYDLALRESSGRSTTSSIPEVADAEEEQGETRSADALAHPPESENDSHSAPDEVRQNVPLENGEAVRPPLSPPPPQQQDSLTGSLEGVRQRSPLGPSRPPSSNSHSHSHNHDEDHSEEDETRFREENPDILAEFTTNVQENVQENLDRLRRVNLADGWDSGTSAEEMSDDLMLGLRDGFCGALSSFSSWNNAMVSLIRSGQVGEALVGYVIGLQLPIISYRFGQHVAVYVFIWRTRRETRKDERRGYGIRVAVDEESERCNNNNNSGGGDSSDDDDDDDDDDDEEEKPSVRAIVTAIFIMALVTQCTSISFFNDPDDQQIALSLLFSPFGVLARWRLSKLNKWRPTFPIGTFTCNLLACALSGSLGTILAGSPGPEERIVLVSFIAGFGGTLSSLANFVVEILAGVDPILLRFDGMIYAVVSVGCAFILGLIFTASVEWADQVGMASDDEPSPMNDDAMSGMNATNETQFLF